MKYISNSVDETGAIAKGLLQTLIPKKTATVLALYGELGSGKTTFVQKLSKALGVTEVVQSPTFVIMKTYQVHQKAGTSMPLFHFLFHIDAYRLDDPIELGRLGWKEILSEPLNLVVIEWADRVETLLPQDAKRIKFTFVDDTKRSIEFD